MRMNPDHMASGNFVLGRDVLCEFADYWPLAAPRVWHFSAFHLLSKATLYQSNATKNSFAKDVHSY